MVCFQLLLCLFALTLSRSRVLRWTLLIRCLLSCFLSHSLFFFTSLSTYSMNTTSHHAKSGGSTGFTYLSVPFALVVLWCCVRTDARTNGRTNGDVITKTKISGIVGLPNFLTHGVPRTHLRRAELLFKDYEDLPYKYVEIPITFNGESKRLEHWFFFLIFTYKL